MNSWGSNPESPRANKSAYYPLDQPFFVYYYMNLFYFVKDQDEADIAVAPVMSYDQFLCEWLVFQQKKEFIHDCNIQQPLPCHL